MSDRLLELIGDGQVHVVDGAMGTVLYARGVFVNVCYDELNLTQPDVVRGVHSDYVRAGAELIETNTFGANPVKLSAYGLEDRTEEINQAAAKIARRAAGDRACALGAIGPLGIRIEPWGPTSVDEAEGMFSRQAEGLAAGGVDGFVIETFADLDELLAAVRAVRAVSDRPIFAQMSFGDDGRTAYGTTIDQVGAGLEEADVQVVGLNCSVGPSSALEALERLVETTTKPTSAQPNAGLPRDVGDRKIYLASPEYMARYARRLAEAGARFVGGCCGTTPEHTRHMAALLGGAHAGSPRVRVVPTGGDEEPRVETIALRDRSSLGRKLAHGEFVRLIELSPPRGWEVRELVGQCRHARDGGADAICLVEGQGTRSRMGAVPAGLMVEREVGIETLVQYTCRDRNMLGMVSDLLGAAAAGVRNLLLTTGDPSRGGPYDTTGVYDIDSIGLTNVVHELNQGRDPGGSPIGAPTSFVIGATLNHTAVDEEEELKRFGWKVDAGADFAVVQSVFDAERFEAFFERLNGSRVPLIATLWPPLSLRNAEFLANEVPGVHVPTAVIGRMRDAETVSPERAASEGVRIAAEVLAAIRPLVQGVLVHVPGGRVERGLAVLDQAIADSESSSRSTAASTAS